MLLGSNLLGSVACGRHLQKKKRRQTPVKTTTPREARGLPGGLSNLPSLVPLLETYLLERRRRISARPASARPISEAPESVTLQVLPVPGSACRCRSEVDVSCAG